MQKCSSLSGPFLRLRALRPSVLRLSSILVLATVFLMDYSTAMAEARYSSYASTPIDFIFSLSNADLDLSTPNTEYPVSLEKISVSVFNTLDPQLQLGFLAGQSYLSLSNDAATAGMHLSGYHVGLAIRGCFGGHNSGNYSSSNPQVKLQVTYLYQETKDTLEAQSATLSWHELTADASVKLNISQRFGIILGGSYSDLDAQRRATGDINETVKLNLDPGTQSRLALELRTPPNGRVSLVFRRGAYDGITLNFARQFR